MCYQEMEGEGSAVAYRCGKHKILLQLARKENAANGAAFSGGAPMEWNEVRAQLEVIIAAILSTPSSEGADSLVPQFRNSLTP